VEKNTAVGFKRNEGNKMNQEIIEMEPRKVSRYYEQQDVKKTTSVELSSNFHLWAIGAVVLGLMLLPAAPLLLAIGIGFAIWWAKKNA